jgi:hypothetical protein
MGMGHEVYAQETTNKPELRQNQRTESTLVGLWTGGWWLTAQEAIAQQQQATRHQGSGRARTSKGEQGLGVACGYALFELGPDTLTMQVKLWK